MVITRMALRRRPAVHQSICFGQHAYATVELSDKSGAIEYIVNGVGSAGRTTRQAARHYRR